MNVLIVDDDKLARKGLVAIMDWKKYGFEVVGDVQNGRKALEFLRNHPVDIVFTDIDMPEIDGLELMQICGEEFPEIKFVILSVYESFSYAQTAIRMGALDYISKISFSPEECGTILERVRAKYMQTCRDFIGTLVQIYKFTKKDESRTVFRRRFVARSGLRRPDQPMISIFTSRRMAAAGTSITWHFSFSSNTGFTLRPPTFALSIFPAAGS